MINDNDFIWKNCIWNIKKNEINTQKHGVSFIEASTVFDDEDAVYIDDEEHSQYEKRFIVLGLSEETRLLIVCYCERESNSLTRIISAREAERKEKELYGKRNRGK